MTIGERIRFVRENAQMTQDQLGQLCGTTKQTIFKYETNVITNIPLDRVEKIAEVLNVTPAYLTGWEGSLSVFDPKDKPASSSESGLSEDEIQFIDWYRNQASDKDKALLRTMRGF